MGLAHKEAKTAQQAKTRSSYSSRLLSWLAMVPNFVAARKMHVCEVGLMYNFSPLPHLWLGVKGVGVMFNVMSRGTGLDKESLFDGRMLQWSFGT